MSYFYNVKMDKQFVDVQARPWREFNGGEEKKQVIIRRE